ncbi:UPF0287-domain-containing protein [Acaromyces ingoldii]|uniref:COX assembly mitochondrial protein n=1 Tax=Acaromyces ingoldii TaxID=215250 RepID=A0A316YXF3_9BASI|nr:UPF0287-domain-containing protein [Acaromyces ingoldii]PWN93949.1 UPF0287-domain-containing protein [Acaromyces ingoldii]
MHPHLANDKKLHCGELIQRLQECHEHGFWNRLLGSCNGIKEELNQCLREERIARTARNREESRAQRERTRHLWKAIEDQS